MVSVTVSDANLHSKWLRSLGGPAQPHVHILSPCTQDTVFIPGDITVSFNVHIRPCFISDNIALVASPKTNEKSGYPERTVILRSSVLNTIACLADGRTFNARSLSISGIRDLRTSV